MGLLDYFFGPPGPDKFARLLKTAIIKAGETEPIEYDSAEFRLQGKSTILNLSAAYEEYRRANKQQRQIILRNFVQTWFSSRREVPEEFEHARHDLLPGIRNRMMFEHTRMTMKMAGKEGFNWPFRVLAEFLGIGLVYDEPSSMMQVQQHMLDDWQVSFEDALAVAQVNLGEITKHMLNQVAPGLWRSPWNDNYDPSRMLLIDYIRHHEVRGAPVVLVPNRDTLLLTGDDDAAGLARLAELGEEAIDHPRFLSGIAYRLNDDDEWEPYLPRVKRQQFKMLEIKTLGPAYSEQQQALNELHEKTGKDIFVASYSAVQKQDTGEVQTYCVWSEGLVTFLPRTDYIYFFRPTGEDTGEIVATAPWEQVAAALGDRLKPIDIFPERFLVEDFPSDDELARFGKLED